MHGGREVRLCTEEALEQYCRLRDAVAKRSGFFKGKREFRKWKVVAQIVVIDAQ